MKKYNISKPEKYLSNGVEKTYWANVGTMTEWPKEDGSVSRIIEIPAIGLKANIFPIEPKADREFDQSYQTKPKYQDGEVPPSQVPSYPEAPDPADIPF